MVLKVLIVGGGVAGPSLAYWLSRLNTEVTLIKRFPRIRAHGQQVDIRGQGVPMMKKMGIESAIRAAAVHEPGMRLIDQTGKYDLTKATKNVNHIFETSVKSFTQDDDNDPEGKVHVVLSDGRKEDFDLVIGADGSGSQIRNMMLGPDPPAHRHSLNAHIGFFTIPSLPDDSKSWTLCHLPGRRIIGTGQDRPDILRIYMIIYGHQPALEVAYKSSSLRKLKDTWAGLYDDSSWETERFMDGLKHSPLSDDLYATRLDEIRLPKGSWSKGRVVPLGDAAHCQTVNGQGVALGMVGAYVLAGEIATLAQTNGSTLAGAVVQGAKNYEYRFRPMICQTQGSGFGIGLFLPQSKLGIGILHTIAGGAASFGHGQSGSGGMDRKATWLIPEYPFLDVDR